MNGFPQYDVEIEETHHIHKLDHPSVTAITLAEEIVEKIDRKEQWTVGTVVNPDGTVSGSKEASDKALRIDSIRRDEVPGIHTVTWDSPVDTISITHSAKSREGFALGAVLAAEWLKGKTGWHTMDEVLDY